jgi:hypothetical protein
MCREGERPKHPNEGEVANIEAARIGAEGGHHEPRSVAREASPD